jgi:SAM-dependent methyltransferase
MTNPFLQGKDRDAWGPGSLEMALPLIEAARIQPGMRVLEVGGGSGQIATILAKHWNVTVFTLEPWFGGAHIQTRAADEGVWDRVVGLKLKAQELPFADETFDAIISVGSFEMIGDDRPSALAEMVRVAKVGARLGIAEPMCMPVPIPPDVAELDRAGNLTFEHHFRSAEWNAELFRGTGLKVVEQSYFPDAFDWWLKYSEEGPASASLQKLMPSSRLASPRKNLERELIQRDGGRWISLGMVVGEKQAS